ncbi:MAG TPA: hypothetical protein PKY82_13930 [Pyrinomonadaceae bacterium]|nr:hypothetical protein [Pyrinomonadaceae bacterium]
MEVSHFPNFIDEFSKPHLPNFNWQILVSKDAFKNDLVGWTLEVGKGIRPKNCRTVLRKQFLPSYFA